MKWLWAYLVFVIVTIAWCTAGLFGWPSGTDRTVNAVCLPINAVWLVWCIWLMRRTRELEACASALTATPNHGRNAT